jgi:hypothetical protein
MNRPESTQRWRLEDGTACKLSAIARAEATLSCSLDARLETFSLIAQRQPEEVAVLEERIGQYGPLPTLCDKAIRCCEVAMRKLSPGGPCDVSMEMGSPPQPDKCFGYLGGIRSLFDAQAKALPEACL